MYRYKQSRNRAITTEITDRRYECIFCKKEYLRLRSDKRMVMCLICVPYKCINCNLILTEDSLSVPHCTGQVIYECKRCRYTYPMNEIEVKDPGYD